MEVEEKENRKFVAFVAVVLVFFCTFFGLAILAPAFSGLPSWAGFFPVIAVLFIPAGASILTYRAILPPKARTSTTLDGKQPSKPGPTDAPEQDQNC